MHWCCSFIISLACIAQSLANYGECPFAQLQNAHLGLLTEPSSYDSTTAASSYEPKLSNPLYDHDTHYKSVLETNGFSTNSLLSRYLQDESEYAAFNMPLSSDNAIYKSYFMESKSSDKQQCAIPPETCANDTSHYYYRSIDGSCNNLQYPGWGMANSRYGRLMSPKYSENNGYAPTVAADGNPLPSARLLSLTLYGDDLIDDDVHTLSFMQWGQIVAHDLSRLTVKGAPDDCCTNIDNKMCYPIALHPHGPISINTQKKCLHFARSISDLDAGCQQYNPNYPEKITTVTAYLDMSSIYGSSQKESEKLRQFTGGLLRTSLINHRHWLPISMNEEGECGKNNYKCYKIPDRRNQFMPSIIVIHTILLREHNRIACALSQLNPHYSDEQLFQEARKITIAQYQKITYYDWLPLLIGSSYAFQNRLIHYFQDGEHINDYDDSIDPAPYAESTTVALRYAHTQVPGYFSLVTPNRGYNESKRLSEYFEKPSNIDFLTDADNFDSIIRGMVTQPQKRADANIDKEIKHFFNRKSTEEYGSDLKSFDIQRARDYGIPTYNDVREYCGLPRAHDWSDFIGEIAADKIELLEKVYKHPDDVDLSVGGSLETHTPESLLGPTFQCIVGRHFSTVRKSDRFFFENDNIYSGFTSEQLAEIRKASLSGLYCNNGDYLQFIQPNSFIVPNPRNILRSCNIIPQIDLNKWKTYPPQPIY